MDLSNIGSVTIFRNIADKHFQKIHLTLMKTCKLVYSFKKLRKDLLLLTFFTAAKASLCIKRFKFATNVENLQALLFPW